MSYHGDCEGVDDADVVQAVLPGDEALYINEELVPHCVKGLIILLIPAMQDTNTHVSHAKLCLWHTYVVQLTITVKCKIHMHICVLGHALTCWRGRWIAGWEAEQAGRRRAPPYPGLRVRLQAIYCVLCYPLECPDHPYRSLSAQKDRTNKRRKWVLEYNTQGLPVHM